jgi:E3 ubiquitin-protein ligase TRIP12
LIKAKAKAERAAARQASQAPLLAALLISAPASTSTPAAEGSVPEGGSGEPQTQDGEDAELDSMMPKEAAPDRTELLRSKPTVIGRFMQLMVPILIDVYAASVITPVRVKTLTGLLKAISFLDADGLKRVLTVCSRK